MCSDIFGYNPDGIFAIHRISTLQKRFVAIASSSQVVDGYHSVDSFRLQRSIAHHDLADAAASRP
jgi:hypothetical protein